jgi:PAS domain-containing protein
MKPAELYHRIRQNKLLQLRNIRIRFSFICFFMLAAVVFLPLLRLQRALLPITVVCLIGLTNSLFPLRWEIRGETPRYGLYWTSFFDILLITIAVHFLGGIETWFSWVYAVFLISISTMRGFRLGIYAAVVSSLMNCALMVGEFLDILPHVAYTTFLLNPGIDYQSKEYLYMRLLGDTILFLFTAVVSGVMSKKLLQKKIELEKKNNQVLAMQEKLQKHADDLEDAVAKRTEELTRANKELEQSFSLLRATLESTDDGILVVDTEGRITS